MASANLVYKTVGTSGISYARDAVLGKGAFAIVHRGFYQGNEVAVKKIPLDRIEEREVKLQRSLTHTNVLKFLLSEDDEDFRYIVLELCAGTLKHFIKGKYTGPMPSDRQVLYQIACGVQYLHSMQLVHRDIKPDNILISCTNPVVMKVSDFGLSKPTSSEGSFSISGKRGTNNWIAPEFLLLPTRSKKVKVTRGSVQSDIFAVGCVYFYFTTRGLHPFGDQLSIGKNILENDPVNLTKLPKEHFAYDLIEKMIEHKEEERIALTTVIKTLSSCATAQAADPDFRRDDQFKAIERSFPQISGWCRSRFHPTDPVLASGSVDSSSVILLKGANGSIPFSNWKIEQEFKRQTQSGILELEWNVNGTQLAAGLRDGTVVVWSFPSGRKIFEEKKHSIFVNLIAWNPFRQDVLATRHGEFGKELLFWNSRGENGDAGKAHHILTLKRDEGIRSVAWISANQIAIGLGKGKIEICEIDEDKGTSRVIKQFEHSKSEDFWITGLQWNEGTKYLASSSWNDQWIKIWSMDSDKAVHTLQVHSICRELAWRRNMKMDDGRGIDAARKDKEKFIIAGGLGDGSIVVWNPLEEDVIKRKRILPQKHSNSVWSVSFSPDGRFLASTDVKDELIIWSTQTWLPVFNCQNGYWNHSSWMSTDLSSVPINKLAVISKDKILVVEQSFTD